MEHISKHLQSTTALPAHEARQIGTPSNNGASGLTNTETNFLAALGGQRIRACTGEQIAAELRYLMQLVGIRRENYPDKDVIVVIIAHIQEHHGNLTIRNKLLGVNTQRDCSRQFF